MLDLLSKAVLSLAKWNIWSRLTI